MLQTATIDPGTLALLRRVMAEPMLKKFNLVGGTSLALQIGHRMSIDLDLFTYEDFENNEILQLLQTFGDLVVLVDKPPFLQVKLNEIKLDFLKFPYLMVSEYIEIEGVRLVGIESIAVMKLLAISRRGSKKDFYDLYFILERHTLAEILENFKSRFPGVDTFHIIKSLTYFSDANLEADPKMLQKVGWKQVKKKVSLVVEEWLSKF